MPQYRRLVTKLSGQAIAGSAQFGFNTDSLTHLANEVISARNTGVQVAGSLVAATSFEATGQTTGELTESRPTTSECSAPSSTPFCCVEGWPHSAEQMCDS
jgi:hypothetical protein